MGRPRLSEEEKVASKNKRSAKQRVVRQKVREVNEARRERLRGLKEDANARLNAPVSLPPAGSVEVIKGAFQPSNEDRSRVATLVGLGLAREEIALMVMNPKTGSFINLATLNRHFEKELSQGVIRANSKVAAAMYEMAVGVKDRDTGKWILKPNMAAASFWLKTRAGWHETQHVEIEVKSGVLIAPPATSPQDWVEAAQKRNAEKTEPGKQVEGVA